MRPKAVVTFERLYLLTLAIGAVHTARLWPALTANTAPGTLLVIQLVTFGLTVLLVLLTSRRRSRIAAIILLATFLIGLPVALGQLGALVRDGISAVILVLQLLLQTVALIMLVTPSSRAWLWSDADRAARDG